jgi:hypothetical protein
MTKQELSIILNKMVSSASQGKITIQYLLFGIEYAGYIKDADFTADDIAEDAGLSRKYGIEIRKGIRLSSLVEIKNDNSFGRLQSCYKEKERLEDLVKRQKDRINHLTNKLKENGLI